MNNINSIDNKSKIAIVVVGYNRIKSIQRLLGSLLNAKYPSDDIPLVLSIDCSGDEGLYQYVREFKWQFGEKYVIIQQTRLGLKEHILKCGDLSQYFKAIILLEDDLYVSPYFYFYTTAAVEKYNNNKYIAGISLYKNETNGYVGLPFSPLNNGSDVFALQETSTWGECWTESMWNGFKNWLKDGKTDIMTVDMPEQIKRWDQAWSKYYNAYLVSCDKYFIFPYISLTTNFNDAGVHGQNNNTIVQSNLLCGKKQYFMFDFDKLVRYDIYFNNADLFKSLWLDDNELCVDLYGSNPNYQNKRYLLSVLSFPYKSVHNFALNLRPHELNIIYDIPGNDIHLYDTSQKILKKIKPKLNLEFFTYHLQGFNWKYLLFSVLRYYLDAVKRKVKLPMINNLFNS